MREGRERVCVEKEVEERGIEMKNIDMVINDDMKKNKDKIMNSYGSKGREGRKGKWVMVVKL